MQHTKNQSHSAPRIPPSAQCTTCDILKETNLSCAKDYHPQIDVTCGTSAAQQRKLQQRCDSTLKQKPCGLESVWTTNSP
jgi:hypothetical protein